MQFSLLLNLSFLLLVLTSISAIPDGRGRGVPRPFTNSEQLDEGGKLKLSWYVDKDRQEITFGLEAETVGYVGLGISPTGSMKGADIFIAGVDDKGKAYHSDRHGLGFFEPAIDKLDNWKLLEAKEERGKTFLTFSRLLNTCDEEDYPIGEDTVRLIWAMGKNDRIANHDSLRGTKSVILLGPPAPLFVATKYESFDLKYTAHYPSSGTTYWCSYHRSQPLPQKIHVVAVEPILPTQTSLRHTHHFFLRRCYGDGENLTEVLASLTVQDGNNGESCDDIRNTRYCEEIIYGFAKGGSKLIIPEHIGIPLGPSEENFYRIEVHIDNPSNLTDLEYELGVRIYYTKQMREHEAGLFAIGADLSSIFVPPNTKEFTIPGHCPPACTESYFPKDGINVFSSTLHAHLSGRKMKVRQFREKVELPWPDFDDHYDFDYQQSKILPKEIVLKPGDHLTVECTYDSTWRNGQVVIGGKSTTNEMCLAYMYYYPKMEMEYCQSLTFMTMDNVKKTFGITKYTQRWKPTLGYPTIEIYEPESLAGDFETSMSYNYTWNSTNVQELQDRVMTEPHRGLCGISLSSAPLKIVNNLTYPQLVKAYVPPKVCGNGTALSRQGFNNGSNNNASYYAIHILSLLSLFCLIRQ